MRRSQWTRVVAALAIGGAAALTVPLSPAVADHSPAGFHHDVEIAGPATLVSKGAAVTVEVEYRCGPDAAFAGLDVRVTQARGNHLAQGFGSTSPLWCDGLWHSADVTVTAGGTAFKNGDALVEAHLFVCGNFPSPCATDEDIEEVTVGK